MKKRIFAIFAVMMVLFALVGCSPKKQDPAEAKVIKVGVAIYRYDDNFMTLYREEIVAYFATLNTDAVKYEVSVVDSKNDQATQTTQVETFINDEYDVLIINLVQSSAAAQIIEKAKAADIPLVLINREPEAAEMELYDKLTYVGADAKQSGTYQGEIIVETPNGGDINGDGKVSYIMLVGDPENTDAKYRTEYSVQALVDAGIEVEELFKQRGDWLQENGQQLTETALNSYGDKIEVVFANNDAMALGAAQAIEAAGRVVGEDIYLVGVDALPEAVLLVNEGKMTGTVLNDHVGQSHAAVDTAIKLANGETVEKYVWVDYVKVKPEAE